jgi:hypothetical protein
LHRKIFENLMQNRFLHRPVPKVGAMMRTLCLNGGQIQKRAHFYR